MRGIEINVKQVIWIAINSIDVRIRKNVEKPREDHTAMCHVHRCMSQIRFASRIKFGIRQKKVLIDHEYPGVQAMH